MNAPAANTQDGNLLYRIVKDYVDGFRNLTHCPREIWLAYILKILESLCYFSSVLVLMIFLTQDMGLSDVAAGWTFGVFSASMSFFMLFVGFIADSMGIKKALIVGLVISLIGRVAITFTLNPYIVYPGLAVLSIGFAYMIPLIAASVKLFSTKKAQKYAFSWYYVVMNVGSLIAGLSLDWLRNTFTTTIEFTFLDIDLVIRPIQMIFLVAILATFVSLFIVIFLVRTHIPVEELQADEDEKTGSDAAISAAARAKSEKKSSWQVMKEVINEKTFWIFMVFIFFLVLVKMIFQYNHSLYPLYMERIGLQSWTGKLYAINPAIIIFLVPVMTAITHNMRAYNVIMLGSFVAAGSVFFMGLGEAIVWIVLFQVVLSIGEAIYSPAIYDYTATIAPPGKEASYMAYSKAPMFFAKVAAGPITGILLNNLCADGSSAAERNTELMWIIVGISTMVSPIMLFLTRRWLDVETKKQTVASH